MTLILGVACILIGVVILFILKDSDIVISARVSQQKPPAILIIPKIIIAIGIIVVLVSFIKMF